MMKNTVSLVIDDKIEDGSLICDYLRREFSPYHFYHYDEKKFQDDKQSFEKLTGIRIIFQDLALISSTHPTKTDYDAVADTIEMLLSEKNGPWLLITWSTWSSSDDHLIDTEYPCQLFQHLRNELPKSLQPFDYIAIDKSYFTSNGRHGTAKSMNEMSTKENEDLSKKIHDAVSKNRSINFLSEWELNLKSAIYSTTSELSQLAIQREDEQDNALGRIIFELASAYAGKHTQDEDYLQHCFSEIFSDIIRDKIEHNSDTGAVNFLSDFSRIDKKILDPIENWREKLNRSIHIDMHNFEKTQSSPGSVFIIEEEDNVNLISKFLDELDTKNKINKFKRKHFLGFLKEENKTKEFICNKAKIICIDITPPCDYANKKAEWNKYIVGLLIPIDIEKHCFLIKRKEDNECERDNNKLSGDNLLLGPKMHLSFENESGVFRIVFNSKLTISSPSDTIPVVLGDKFFCRIREQLLSDVRSWFIRQTTRPGIIELR